MESLFAGRNMMLLVPLSVSLSVFKCTLCYWIGGKRDLFGMGTGAIIFISNIFYSAFILKLPVE